MGRKAYRNDAFARIIKGNPNYKGSNKFRKNGLSAGFETMKELKEELSVDRSTITRWENGETFPDIRQLIKISEKFNVSVDYLLGLTTCDSIDGNVRVATEITGLSTESVENIIDIKNEVPNEFDLPDDYIGNVNILNYLLEDKAFLEELLELINGAIITAFEGKIFNDDRADVVGRFSKEGIAYEIPINLVSEFYKFKIADLVKEKTTSLCNELISIVEQVENIMEEI